MLNDECSSPSKTKKILQCSRVDLDNLARRLVMGLVNRKLYEKRHGHDNQQGGSDDTPF